MRQFSAAVPSRTLRPLAALLSSPRGRHATAVGRRRRSTRVRRYVALPEPSTQVSGVPEPSELPAPRLVPPSESSAADDVALVRPYYGVHAHLREAAARVPGLRRPNAPFPVPAPVPAPESDEVAREFARVQERAAALRRQWSAAREGDLLADPPPRFGVVRPAGSAPTGEWDELASPTRTWLSGQRRRQGVPA